MREREIHVVTFATDNMSRSAEACYLSAAIKGKTGTRHFRFTPYDLTRLPYYKEHQALFDASRGPSYWAWKPALLNRVMGPDSFVFDVMQDDIVIYADVGIEFINNVSHIIDRMDQDIFLFGNMWEHAHWCKRDIVEAIWPLSTDNDSVGATVAGARRKKIRSDDDEEMEWARFSKQVQASVIFFRVSDYTKCFVKEWLDWCLFEGGRLIDDSPGGAPNHPEFQENRHDQAILTTLAYRDGIKLHWWPASYNDGAFIYEKGEYTDDYPVIVNHHRRRNEDWPDYLVFKAECDKKIDAVLGSIPGLERVV